MDYVEFVRKLPKSELHIHLEGLITEDSLMQFIQKYGYLQILDLYINKCRRRGVIPSERFLNVSTLNEKEILKQIHKFKYDNLNDFIDTHRFFSCFIIDINDFKVLMNDCVLYCKQMNINYAEIIVSLRDYLQMGIKLEDILFTLAEYRFKENIQLCWVLDVGWSSEKEYSLNLLKRTLSNKYYCFGGITLGGKAEVNKINDFIPIYTFATSIGLGCSVHTGEADDVGTMWKVVELLRPKRVGHGIKAVYNDELIHYLKEKNIPLEICILSNYATNVIDDKSEHPIFTFLKNDVPVVISSDDPYFFNTNLCNEYSYLLEHGVGVAQIYKLIYNSYNYSWMRVDEKELYLKKLRQSLLDLCSENNEIYEEFFNILK